MVTLGRRLKELRGSRPQNQVSEAIGVAPSTYNEYEKDKKFPKEEKLLKLAELFNTSIDYLLGRTNNPLPVEEDRLDLEKVLKTPNVTYKGKEIPAKDLDLFIDLADRILDHLEKKKH
jgi:transcriptional regulator with XRE-family HTH domain